MPLLEDCTYTMFAMFGVEELKWAAERIDLNPTTHLCDKLEHQLPPRPPPPNNTA